MEGGFGYRKILRMDHYYNKKQGSTTIAQNRDSLQSIILALWPVRKHGFAHLLGIDGFREVKAGGPA
jgi:hypothetical protein